MILGQSHTCDLNRPGVRCHLGVNNLLFMRLGHNDPWVDCTYHLNRYGVKSNIIMIAKVCDRESRRDSWFENCLV